MSCLSHYNVGCRCKANVKQLTCGEHEFMAHQTELDPKQHMVELVSGLTLPFTAEYNLLFYLWGKCVHLFKVQSKEV